MCLLKQLENQAGLTDIIIGNHSLKSEQQSI